MQNEKAMKPKYGCPVTAAVKVVAGKWKVAIVWHLMSGTKRYSRLRELMPGVSEKVLTAQLRDLESDGVLRRRSAHSSPPQVSYELSAAGAELAPLMRGLCGWGTKYLGVLPTFPAGESPSSKAEAR